MSTTSATPEAPGGPAATISIAPEPDGGSVPNPDSGGMLVGIDGSAGSHHALRWAAERTDRFGPIRLLTTWHLPWWAYSAPIPPESDEFKRQAEATLASAAKVLGDEQAPAVMSRGSAGQVLVDVGASANLIVVGTRGRSGFKDNLLGSVSSFVVSRASVPVAVVPAEAPIEDVHGRVLVGVDGSISSLAALLWAVKHTPQGSTIEVVHGWSYPPSTMSDVATVPSELYEDRAQRVLDDALLSLERASGGASRRHEIVSSLVYGDPRSVLAERAPSADLVVLGARSHRGVSHLLLGSVTTSLVHQPVTTTVVVPVTEH